MAVTIVQSFTSLTLTATPKQHSITDFQPTSHCSAQGMLHFIHHVPTGCPCTSNLMIVTRLQWSAPPYYIFHSSSIHPPTLFATDDLKAFYIPPPSPPLIYLCLMSKFHLFLVCTSVLQLRKCIHVQSDLE